MTVVVGARNLFKADAGVVHALLQARYYDGSKGQFLSEDPVFLGEPKQQVLTDPQSLNSYSYANDNPITKSDPTGRCIYDGCAVEAVAALGFAGGIATQAFHDYSTGDFSRRSAGKNVATYLTAGGAGAIVAGATAVAGLETVGLGLAARFGAAGLTSGVLTAATDVGANSILRQPTDGGAVLNDAIANGFASGFLTFLPGVRGLRPQSIWSALDLTKAHAARSGAEAAFGTSMQMFGAAGYQLMNSGATGSGSRSGGGSQGSKTQSSGNSVSTWMGSFNPFSPH